MKRIHLFFVAALLSAGIITSCATAPEKPQEIPAQPADENTPEPEKEPEPAVQPEEEEKQPEDPPDIAFVKLLRQELENDNITAAIGLFGTMPEELKSDLELKILLASLYVSDGQYENAVTVADEILAEEPHNLDALELKSITARASGDRNAYREINARILEADPYNPAANIQQGEDLALSRKFKQARNAYKKALKNDPQNTDALFGYAQMSFYLDDIKTTRDTLQKILEIDAKNPQALAYMGKLAAENQNYLRAAEYVSAALEGDSGNYDYWMDMGTYLRYQGKFQDAVGAWEKAVSIDPSYFLAYAYLAGLYDETGKFDLALKNYYKVIETNPKYFYAYESIGILEYHAENWESARKYFAEAYKYSKNYSYPLMIAATYLKQKDTVNCRKTLAPVLKTLDRDSPEYSMVRFYHDTYSRNAENSLVTKLPKIDNSNTRGKMFFYMGLYYELNGFRERAAEYYTKVTDMQAPMFFEYRLAEWGLGL